MPGTITTGSAFITEDVMPGFVVRVSQCVPLKTKIGDPKITSES